jgi:hypothetical protein
MKDDIITWHRQFYAIVKPYIPKELDEESDDESDDELDDWTSYRFI